MQDTIYLAEGIDAHGETTRAIEISLLGVTPGEASTFLPDKECDLAAAWQEWIEQWFVPVLAPAFVAVHQFAEKFHLQETAAVDFDLDQKLPDFLRTRSLKAGALFLDGKSEMKHHPELLRFSQKIEKGETPGHALTLAALQTVLFHLGLIPALTSYAWFEFHSGLAGAGIKDAEEKADVFIKIVPQLRLAVPAGICEDELGNDGTYLRAI